MCRYAFHNYKNHYACFVCRKSFKHPGPSSMTTEQVQIQVGRLTKWIERPVPLSIHCPECTREMHDMGLDFKAPRKNDLEQWHKVKRLSDAGVTFHSCGCGGPGWRPQRLNEVAAFLERTQTQSPGLALLNRTPKRKLSLARL
jgi:hypothetical protein